MIGVRISVAIFDHLFLSKVGGTLDRSIFPEVLRAQR